MIPCLSAQSLHAPTGGWSIQTLAVGTRCSQKQVPQTASLELPPAQHTAARIQPHVLQEQSREQLTTQGKSRSQALTSAPLPNIPWQLSRRILESMSP